MLDDNKKQKSSIILKSTDEMIAQIGEDEMYRIHLLVKSPLSPNLLERWKALEGEDTKRFIIFYPKEPTRDQSSSSYKIESMLSGIITKNSDGKEIYTVINSASEDTSIKNCV